MTTDLPLEVRTIASRVEHRLAGLLEVERTRWRAVDPDIDFPLRALETAVPSGGKRLRPAFCYWGWVAGGGRVSDDSAREAVDALGAAIELFHGFALIHDDVMDGATVRRGIATAHVTFSDHHASKAWRGESRRFGESVAILVGDLAHVLAASLVDGAPCRTRELWKEMQLELVVGQYLDLLHTADRQVDSDRVRLIALLKSGRYTVDYPLRLGASLVEPRDGVNHQPVQAALSAFGQSLGMSFQLRDDILGSVGDPALTGKPVGNDLRSGRPTALLALAIERATPAQRNTLDLVGQPSLDGQHVEALQRVLLDTGAIHSIEEEIASLTRQAIEAIEEAPISETAREALVEMARFVSGRRG